MSGFIFGLFAPVYGFRRLLTDSHLRALAVIPLLISLVVGTFLTVGGLYFLTSCVSSISRELSLMLQLDPAGFANIAIIIVLWPVGLLILGVGVYMSIRLFAAPFYSYLAEKTLVKLGTRRDKKINLREWSVISLRMLAVSLMKSILFGVAGVIFFVFSLVPGLNIIAAIGFFHLIAFDISDYAFEAMEWPLRRRFDHVRAHAVTYTGLACGLGLAMSIPGLNLILLPAAVVGASETLHRTLGASREELP